LFSPADEEDLAYVLSALPRDIPITAMGLGSNLIVRDGGIPGLIIRLGGRAFGAVEVADDCRVVAGAAAPDQYVAKAAAMAGVDGLAFLRGVPGSIGGALVMNAGAHGGEIKDVLIEAHGLDRTGASHVFSNAEMGFSYRRSLAPDDVVFTGAVFQGRPGEPKAIEAEMERITRAREASQPIREKTGGSTFKNPPGQKAWELIDKAGCRGLRLGGAQVSTMHCNFLINLGSATAADLEALGEEVRRRVLETSGVALEWEIKRIGVPLSRES
jgi:UDP-N-acetylmuramate dehydrogenase